MKSVPVTPSPGLSSRAGSRGKEGGVGWKGANLLIAEKGNSAQGREAQLGPQEEGQNPFKDIVPPRTPKTPGTTTMLALALPHGVEPLM